MKFNVNKPVMKTSEPLDELPLPETHEENERARREAAERIRQFQKYSFRGLWYLAIFLLMSLGVQQGVGHLPVFPPSLKQLLGAPPSSAMISGLLIVYSFSALILILGRMTTGTATFSGFSHLGYLLVFYAFYYVSNALYDNYLAVLAAGITILSLEAYHVWTWNQDRIRQEKHYIVRLDRIREWKGKGRENRTENC